MGMESKLPENLRSSGVGVFPPQIPGLSLPNNESQIEFYFLLTGWGYGDRRGPKYTSVHLLRPENGNLRAFLSESTGETRLLVNVAGLTALLGVLSHSGESRLLGLGRRR